MNLRGVPIGVRLGAAFAVVMVLIASLVVGGNVMSDRSMAALTSGQMAANAKGALAETMKGALLESALAMRNMGLQSEVAAMQAEQDKVKAQRKRYADARERLVALGLGEAERAVLDNIAQLDNETEQPFMEAIGQSLNFNSEVAAKILSTRIDPLTQRSIGEINKLVEMEQAAASRLLEQTAVAEARRHMVFYGVAAIVFALGFLFAWTITRSITRPLKDAVAIASTVAGGDLTSEVRVQGRDETSQLMRALRDMNAGLREIVAEVRGGTERISTASRQISAGNTDLSARTEEQASSLEETASSMEELTSTVKQNAENARQANQHAIGASQVAAAGGRAMGEVMAMMNGISESSRRIGDIIGVIDGIAFQTNILALNAAVEAARAGEQGRGFAVVASEVRTLAQRSADAAKEIKALIQDSASRVDGGTRLVQGAGKTMDEIVGAVKQVTDIMAGIAAASQEQLAGIEQVGNAITQMDRVTQQNASLVGQSAAAAEHMTAQAEQLVHVVARFRLGSHDAVEARPARAATPAAAQPPVIQASHAADHAIAQIRAAAAAPKARNSGAATVRGEFQEDWKEF
ncbi:MAG TPA: methyl-accepting chemotaxis protein [Usitatibacter sp.]|nr:methyl-accepting chemotaxis protein [Usitatibacter sp.]